MRLLWLPDVLRAARLNVVTIDGWETRGKELAEVRGIVWHHDAAAVGASTASVEHLLVVGRSDLPGPLCQLALRRDGTWVVVAAGRANHNGYGTWGNESIGVEARNNGTGQPWPDVQVESYVSGTAAICRHLGLTVAAVKGHKETDPRRKIDPAGIDMDQARQRIAMRITYRPPTTPTTPEPEDIDMATAAELQSQIDGLKAMDKLVWAAAKKHAEDRDSLIIAWAKGRLDATDDDVADLERQLAALATPDGLA